MICMVWTLQHHIEKTNGEGEGCHKCARTDRHTDTHSEYSVNLSVSDSQWNVFCQLLEGPPSGNNPLAMPLQVTPSQQRGGRQGKGWVGVKSIQLIHTIIKQHQNRNEWLQYSKQADRNVRDQDQQLPKVRWGKSGEEQIHTVRKKVYENVWIKVLAEWLLGSCPVLRGSKSGWVSWKLEVSAARLGPRNCFMR